MTPRIRVGTRRSPLALAQTTLVLRVLARRHHGIDFEPVPLVTTGDRDLAPGGSPDFTDAIDRALLRGEVDLAVHSAKDLPLTLADGLELVACPRRADPRDCLVVRRPGFASALPPAARVGSSSLRRRAQLLRWRPDLRVVELRGNVDSRIAKVRAGKLDAAALALAGVRRLGRGEEVGLALPLSEFLPAPAQGALALVASSRDRRLRRLLRVVDHGPTHAAVTAERSFALALGGDCRTPLAALARASSRGIRITGEVLSPDGRVRLRGSDAGPPGRAASLGARLGRSLLRLGAATLLSGSPR